VRVPALASGFGWAGGFASPLGLAERVLEAVVWVLRRRLGWLN